MTTSRVTKQEFIIPQSGDQSLKWVSLGWHRAVHRLWETPFPGLCQFLEATRIPQLRFPPSTFKANEALKLQSHSSPASL